MHFDEELLCCLCLNSFEDQITLSICAHSYCKFCLEQWELTGAQSCPQCRAKLCTKASTEMIVDGGPQSNILRIRKETQSEVKVSYSRLPNLPLPTPHQDMLLLYHSDDVLEHASESDPNHCPLLCYVEQYTKTRRFFYCENCNNAYHRIQYQFPTVEIRNSRLGGISAPTTQLMIKNPTSKANISLETQQRLKGNIEIHIQMLGHAIDCTNNNCSYPTCALMKKYLFPEERTPKKQKAIPANVISRDGTYPEAEQRAEAISRSVGTSHGCRFCIRIVNILVYHIQICKHSSSSSSTGSSDCKVLYCSKLKQLKEQQYK